MSRVPDNVILAAAEAENTPVDLYGYRWYLAPWSHVRVPVPREVHGYVTREEVPLHEHLKTVELTPTYRVVADGKVWLVDWDDRYRVAAARPLEE